MDQSSKELTTKEFAEATGIPTATISKLIRDGKIKAKKEGKAWMIPSSQLESETIRKFKKTPKAAVKTKAAMTYEPEVVAPELPEQAAACASLDSPTAPEEAAPQPTCEPTLLEKSYSIQEFAAMTYLTEKGVCEWLRSGRLCGCKTETGELRVLESNLNVSDISRLIRK